MIYFDHNATTPIDSRVQEAMAPYIQSFYGNPSSLYRLGRLARSAIETARAQLAALVDVHPEQIVFTSGGTEANNLAISNVADQATVAFSGTEHPSVINPILKQQTRFKDTLQLAVDQSGSINNAEYTLSRLSSGDFVSVMLANNETGTLQNIDKLTGNFRDSGIVFHTDAVQALGKVDISFSGLGVDLMSLSSHKIYGPKGCGALVKAREFQLHPNQVGGGQENGYRAGTENVAAIVGFGKAAELAKEELTMRKQKLLQLRQRLESGLQLLPGIVIFAQSAPRLPNTVQTAIAGLDGEMLQMQLDKENIAVSSGSACASGKTAASDVLLAMGIDAELAKGAIRISLGKDSSEEEIDHFLRTLTHIVDKRGRT